LLPLPTPAAAAAGPQAPESPAPSAAPSPAPSPAPAAPSPAPDAAAPGAGAAPDTQSPSFPSQIEQVTVDVVVTDKKGAPITGLGREDFALSEDGDPQNIATFEAVQLPPATPSTAPVERPRVSTNTAAEIHSGRTFVVLFDDIHLTPFQSRRAKGAVQEFLTSGVREGDR